MRKYLLFSVYGIFIVLVSLGVLSISPALDNPAIDNGITRQLTSLFAKSTQPTTALATPVPRPTTATQVLGLQTTSSAVSKDILYGLINGFRRDKKQDILVVNRVLEQTAEELLAINRDPRSANDADPASVLKKYGYVARSFTQLTSKRKESNWQVLSSWQSNPRDELLLNSSEFTEMGLAVQCSSDNAPCSALLIIATQ
jgi:hypothetical protein